LGRMIRPALSILRIIPIDNACHCKWQEIGLNKTLGQGGDRPNALSLRWPPQGGAATAKTGEADLAGG
jgi:hypothetical protein